jgi:hypothetical protein
MRIDWDCFLRNIIFFILCNIAGALIGLLLGIFLAFLIYLMSGCPYPYKLSFVTNAILFCGCFGFFMGIFIGFTYIIENYRLYRFITKNTKEK